VDRPLPFLLRQQLEPDLLPQIGDFAAPQQELKFCSPFRFPLAGVLPGPNSAEFAAAR
jgi:hypothetical protein